MLRENWKFDYTTDQLAEAALVKLHFHGERLAFWQGKRKAVMDTIRAEGLEVDEKISTGYANPKARDWHRSAQVMVRNDLQKDLEECLEKLEWHTARRDEYDGWQQFLRAQAGQMQQLDINDWLFFFGRSN
ncbi:MAG: hypothetical protein ROZ37_01295 [Aromatoleum sp.]|jgi:hypothetical protein|uniref:hypothetical protein n=1 Tax=Aromatoleum sp. TaxID=2307007 RepID=UPI002894DC84|nr:hypothetical protein [Aromatoleum sp.]MDT3668951.1 hypothetical protein [Aromatoleum sp.]